MSRSSHSGLPLDSRGDGLRHEPRLPREEMNYSRTRPVREAAVLLGGLVAVAGVLFLVVALLVNLVVPMIPTSWEARLFPGFALLFDRDDTGSEDDSEARLQALLDRMSAHWSDNSYRIEIRVLEEGMPNAFAFPGGLVLVTSGMLEEVESENELAFILGHELGHFRNRDHLRHLGRGAALGLLVAVLRGSGGGESATGFVSLAANLTTRSFSRAQEEEADAFGLELVHREYQTVAGAWDFFDRLPQPGSHLGRQVATYLSTHPLSDERIETLERLASDQGWSSEGEPRPWNDTAH